MQNDTNKCYVSSEKEMTSSTENEEQLHQYDMHLNKRISLGKRQGASNSGVRTV